MATDVPKQIGPYTLGAPLGRGANGVVYRARHDVMDRLVALKIMHVDPQVPSESSASDPSLSTASMFLREAKAAGRLQHPAIVTLYDAGQEEDVYYLAMELIEGENLATTLRRETRLSPPIVIDLGVRVAEGLHAAHRRDVVHRDIKPSNLMMLHNGTVKIADFGIARLVADSSAVGTMAPSGGMVGTANYMSPEQARGEPVDARSDIFSLGVVLYQALTGKKPFARSGMIPTVHAVLEHEPPPAHEVDPSVSPALSDAIAKAMTKDADGRFQTARAFAEALEAARPTSDVDPTVPVAPDDLSAKGPVSKERSRRAPIAIVASLAILLAAGLAWQLWDGAAPRGLVALSSDPSAAEVLVDGERIGRTPLEHALEPGSYTFTIQKPGYHATEVTVDVPADGTIPLDLELMRSGEGDSR